MIKEHLILHEEILNVCKEKIGERIFSKTFQMWHKHNKSIQYVSQNMTEDFYLDFVVYSFISQYKRITKLNDVIQSRFFQKVKLDRAQVNVQSICVWKRSIGILMMFNFLRHFPWFNNEIPATVGIKHCLIFSKIENLYF